ncbi:LuxR family transcriptional regulator [Sphingomonas glacialis]|uniref:LuxR family transcriptional regulator n=1 Tax=Sphingomonas glacialis TaxID=658225 RepID=A0A502FRM6_9SPHN|nr:autoinducer binding domain-containing protein [Sphingomonas glacialis]TPG52227.1 LuxR family transcriptional regulator [Sphingomonas glacialis]
MPRLAIADGFVQHARSAETLDQLHCSLIQCCADMNLRYFALLHHVDFARAGAEVVRLHNYPASWQGWFDENRLGTSDPVLRASHSASIGFPWSAVPRMIKLTAADQSVLSQARIVGIGDGFTVPVHVPGEINGSCSFAVPVGEEFPTSLYPIAQLIGGFAFEAARRISHRRGMWTVGRPTLTDRQIDCVLWAARGKTDLEISIILGISHETVIQHLKMARERYGVQKRAMLAVRALFDGLISFSDILKF